MGRKDTCEGRRRFHVSVRGGRRINVRGGGRVYTSVCVCGGGGEKRRNITRTP